MKKHMEHLTKLKTDELFKRRIELLTDISESRRGVVNGEIQNTQIVKSKRKELARVNTLLNMSSNTSVDKASDTSLNSSKVLSKKESK